MTLRLAFNMICDRSPTHEFVVTREKFYRLMHYVKPEYGVLETEVIFKMLEPRDGGISKLL